MDYILAGIRKFVISLFVQRNDKFVNASQYVISLHNKMSGRDTGSKNLCRDGRVKTLGRRACLEFSSLLLNIKHPCRTEYLTTTPGTTENGSFKKIIISFHVFPFKHPLHC